MGLLFVAYFVVVNVFFDLSAQSPHLAQQPDEPREFADAVAQEEAKLEEKTPVPESTRSWEPKPDRKYVWLDVAIDGVYVGRVTAELYADVVPKTVENFRALTTGEKGPDYSFKGSTCHRILKGFIVQCGDYTKGNGTGGRSIYGGRFDDEPNGLRLKHSKRYILQMANAGPNTNGSQFCFMLGAAPHLNGKHVVFGEVGRLRGCGQDGGSRGGERRHPSAAQGQLHGWRRDSLLDGIREQESREELREKSNGSSAERRRNIYSIAFDGNIAWCFD